MYNCGLVLEGGGLRATYESGVLDAFMENEIEFPYVIGVSAGSCNGVSFLGKNLHRMRDISIGYAQDERYMSVKSIFKNGQYLNLDWVFGELSYDMFPLNDDVFENCGSVFCAVATNALTGKAEYFYPKSFRNGCPELKASCALPIATNGVEMDGFRYFDGGIVDSIPVERAFEDGCQKCVVILTQDINFVKRPFGHEKMVKKFSKKYPLVGEKLLDRHNMYNHQRAYAFEAQDDGDALVICPKEPLHFSTLQSDPYKMREIYYIGYKDGLDNIQKVKDFMASSK